MNRKCQLLKKNGMSCSADAQVGKSVCIFHDPERSSDAVRARRAGGIARSQPASVLSHDTLEQPLRCVKEVSILLGDSINRVRRGEIDPRKVLKRLGYANQNHVRLYGDDLLLVDDPMEMNANLVFVDAIQTKTGRHVRVRIPLNILNMANQQLAA